MEVNNNFPTNYPKWAQFCCLCNVKLDYKDNLWETIVNLHVFCSLNLWRVLSGGLGWSSHTVITISNWLALLSRCVRNLCFSKMSFIISCAFSKRASIFSLFSFLVWGEFITDCTSSRIFVKAFWNLILHSLSPGELWLYASIMLCLRI